MEAILNKMLAAGSAMIGCGVLLTRFFYTVDGGERGIIFDKFRGVRPKVYGEGMHFYVPGLQVLKPIPFISRNYIYIYIYKF